VGEAQIGAGNAAAARVSLRKALAEDPGDWNLWFDLARASEGRAQVVALANARRLNPLSPEVAAFRQELATLGQIAVIGR
jgi:Flp pilus assembly protein TadD